MYLKLSKLYFHSLGDKLRHRNLLNGNSSIGVTKQDPFCKLKQSTQHWVAQSITATSLRAMSKIWSPFEGNIIIFALYESLYSMKVPHTLKEEHMQCTHRNTIKRAEAWAIISNCHSLME